VQLIYHQSGAFTSNEDTNKEAAASVSPGARRGGEGGRGTGAVETGESWMLSAVKVKDTLISIIAPDSNVG